MLRYKINCWSVSWYPDFLIKHSDKTPIRETVAALRALHFCLTSSFSDPDPPVSYDLNFIDNSAQQNQKSNQTKVFKLSTQSPSPTGEDEDSIAKVLDWFNRSTDSNDWLDTEDDPNASERSDRHNAASKFRGENVFAGGERKVEMFETKRRPRKGSEELTETQNDLRGDTKVKKPLQDVRENADERQPMKMSHLKSFWEKSNTGPKVLFSKQVTTGDTELDSDAPPDLESYSRIKYSSEVNDERRQQLVIDQLNHCQQEETLTANSTQRKNHSDHLKLLPSTQIPKRRVETSCVTRPGSSESSVIESESLSAVNPKLPSESKQSLRQDLLSNTHPVPQLDADPQTRVSLDSEKFILSRNNSYVDYDQNESEERVTIEALIHRGSNKDVKKKEDEDKDKHSGSSPKRRGSASNKENTNNPHLNRQASQQQKSTAERIKQLKSFWEQELNKPMFYTGKPKALGGGKVARGASQARLNKRFTKSEFDLTSLGNESSINEEGSNQNANFTVFPLSQRLDHLSPTLSASRAQFNSLREFWDEATSDSKGMLTSEKLKSPKRKEPLRAQLSTNELKSSDLEICPFSTTVETTKGVVTKSYPSPQSRSKSPRDRAMGPGSKVQTDSKSNLISYMSAESGQQKRSKRSSKEPTQEEKSSKLQNGKEIRPPNSRKDSFSFSSSRGNSLRRATSMVALSVNDEKDQNQLQREVNSIQSQSRKPRQNTDKGLLLRRSSDEPETLAPLARAFVPTDYRHYLGMTDASSVHAALIPVIKDDGSEVRSANEPDPGRPVRASTPSSSEERPSRKPNKMSQHPAWGNNSESDTGHESSISSTSETWSNSRTSSNREHHLLFYLIFVF